jgi:dihydroorotate dehydrogenase
VIYRFLFKNILTKIKPEFAHYLAMFGLELAYYSAITKIKTVKPSQTRQIEALGHTFNGPFGLAAGFDKNARWIKPLRDLGFSHVEIGTVTAQPQPGNPRPRLFRLPADRALVNRMGFNNDGAEVIATRIKHLRITNPFGLPIIGANIGKSRVVEVEDAAADYRASAKALAPYADYLAVNVSSPNTPGLRSLQSVEALKPILEAVQDEALGKPILVKIAPDLANEDIVAVANLVLEMGLDGVIATNTTISREGLATPAEVVEAAGAGGLSGAPLHDRSLEVLHLLRPVLQGKATIISVGGIETAEQAQARLDAGATLVQGYTGFVYHGPLWARRINRALK